MDKQTMDLYVEYITLLNTINEMEVEQLLEMENHPRFNELMKLAETAGESVEDMTSALDLLKILFNETKNKEN